MREPSFWWRDPGPTAALLAPIAAGYGAIAARRMIRPGRRLGVPVVCVGNLTVGGAGKTPTAIAIAKLLKAADIAPVFLTRGYGGRLRGPIRVGPAHRAADVGDEPLLLARLAPTIAARDRAAGGSAAVAAGARVIIMDDGFQNPALAKDLSLIAVDGRRGIGNAKIFPAGPLRAPLQAQMERADALLIVGETSPGVEPIVAAARSSGVALLKGRLVPEAATAALLSGQKVLAFAGIADPEKFFATLQAVGIAAPVRRSFPDHHRFTAAEAADLIARAEQDGLALVTTEKDLARMHGDGELGELGRRAKVLAVNLVFDDENAVRRLLLEAIERKI